MEWAGKVQNKKRAVTPVTAPVNSKYLLTTKQKYTMKFKVTTEQSERLEIEVSYLLSCGISAENDYPCWEIKSEFIQRLFSSFVQTEEYRKMDPDRKKDMLEYYFKLEKMLNAFDTIDVYLAKNFAQDAIDYVQGILFPKPTAA